MRISGGLSHQTVQRLRRPGLMAAVLGCAVGAVLVLAAARATWVVEVVERPAPLPAERVEQTGADLRPWLATLGWVALAGAGALIATRGWLRKVVGGLLVLLGIGMALSVLAPAEGGPDGMPDMAWSVLGAAGTLALTGIMTLVQGGRWWALGARYESPAGRARSGSATGGEEATAAELWEALDRGEDPTDRPRRRA